MMATRMVGFRFLAAVLPRKPREAFGHVVQQFIQTHPMFG